MGFFTKKEVCPVCGKNIKGDVLIKIKDNVPLCQACSAQINMDAALIAQQTPEDISRHLDYRRVNQDRVDRFVNTWDERIGPSLICADESQRIWYCTRNKRDRNPPILNFDEVVSAVYLENNEPAEEEEQKGILGGLFGGKKAPRVLRSMKVHIEVDNPYTKSIDVEAVPQNGEIKTGTMSYKSNKRALDRVMDMMAVMMGEKDKPEPAAENEPETGQVTVAEERPATGAEPAVDEKSVTGVVPAVEEKSVTGVVPAVEEKTISEEVSAADENPIA